MSWYGAGFSDIDGFFSSINDTDFRFSLVKP